ncbi:hypothetical protein Tco_0749464 [Tanacetum coccineum]|uniref:Xylulose kinase-1 n=1 Tax=Tanacetum coccineum TaxID=301880 RepID=A0ABQ4Z1J1_9ASTR
MRTASAAAKPCQGDSLELYLITGTPDDCQRSFRHSDTERLSRSDEVLKLKYFKKDATLNLFKSTNQERYEHVDPEVTSSQDGKVNKMVKRDYAWLMISRCSRSYSRQAKEQAQDLKSMITTSNHNALSIILLQLLPIGLVNDTFSHKVLQKRTFIRVVTLGTDISKSQENHQKWAITDTRTEERARAGSQNNEVWKVIQNGNSKKRVTKDKDGVYRVLPLATQEEQFADEKERKARTLLLMAVPKDHLRRFHGMDDTKEIWAAIKTRFGGNANSKKMQKAAGSPWCGVSDEDAITSFGPFLRAWDSIAMTMEQRRY